MDPFAADVREAYREGVDALLAGDAEEAICLLEPHGDGDAVPFELRLALGKAYLGAGRSGEALACLEQIRDPAPSEPGLAAYLELLTATAEALEGAQESALARMETVLRLDPRMEHAARQLRRRIESGKPPAIRF